MGKDHTAFGRGRHPWLTGTAGWAYFAATHWMLGIRPGYEGLEIDPCIPSTWPGFKFTRAWRGATYQVDVENPGHVEKGVRSIVLNGMPVQGVLPVQPVGSRNTVVVVMG
jgi:N,N'-diacetylchitobiose phosphorylase